MNRQEFEVTLLIACSISGASAGLFANEVVCCEIL